MSTLITEERMAMLASTLVNTYVTAAEAGNLNRASQGTLIGLSGSRVSQLATKAKEGSLGAADVSALTFIRLYQAIPLLEEARREGILPASASRGVAQEAALQRLMSAE